MATPEKLLQLGRYRRLFAEISQQIRRKMPCGDVRIAIQLREAGLIRQVNQKRQDVTDAWALTEIGETYVE